MSRATISTELRWSACSLREFHFPSRSDSLPPAIFVPHVSHSRDIPSSPRPDDHAYGRGESSNFRGSRMCRVPARRAFVAPSSPLSRRHDGENSLTRRGLIVDPTSDPTRSDGMTNASRLSRGRASPRSSYAKITHARGTRQARENRPRRVSGLATGGREIRFSIDRSTCYSDSAHWYWWTYIRRRNISHASCFYIFFN